MHSKYVAASVMFLTFTTGNVLAEPPQPLSITFDQTNLPDSMQYQSGGDHQAYTVVPGAAPNTHAVQLDQGAFSFSAPAIVKAFTVEMMIRPLGQGGLRGNDSSANGTLIAEGNGYWDGFRLTVNNPTGELSFEIGRPQPSSSVGIHGGTLANNQWQRIAAVWDGTTERIYINGSLTASGAYSGAFTAPAGGTLKVGYADAGVGSERFAVAQFDVVPSAESSAVLFARAAGLKDLPVNLSVILNDALRAQQMGDEKSERHYWSQLAEPSVRPSALRDRAAMEDATLLENSNQSAAAIKILTALVSGTDNVMRQLAASQLVSMISRDGTAGFSTRTLSIVGNVPDLSSDQYFIVQTAYARKLLRQHDMDPAETVVAYILKLPTLSRQEREDTELTAIHIAADTSHYARALSLIHLYFGPHSSPPEYEAIAELGAAQSAASAGKLSVSRRFLNAVLMDRNAPATLRNEADGELFQTRRDSARSTNAVGDHAMEHRMRTIYVSPMGSDTAPGTRTEPRSLVSAVREVSVVKRDKAQHGLKIMLLGGTYPISHTISFEPPVNSVNVVPLVLTGSGCENTILTGAAQLKNFAPVSDSAILARLDPSVRDHVLQCDLKASGVTDFGTIVEHGFGQPATPITELFYNGKPMTLARWPNTGFLETGAVANTGSVNPDKGMVFVYTGDRPSRWLTDDNIWLNGYWYFDWAGSTAKVQSIDPVNKTITTVRGNQYGIRQGQRYYAFNILEELDAPGEWYIDRTKGILYFYPPGKIVGANIQLSVLSDPLLTVHNMSHMTIRDMTLEGGRETGMTLTDCSHCAVRGVVVRQMGGDAMIVDGGHDNRIAGCDLYTLGRGGIIVSGGDRKTLTPGNQSVVDCDIYDFSRMDRTYTPAVLLEGCGNLIEHNAFHDAPHSAIRIEGNNQVVEYNEVYRVVNEADDQGGLDIWGNASYRGNVFRYNYWHDIGSGMNAVGQAGIRLDDAISGVLIYGNVFQRSSGGNFGGVQINGGKDDVIDNNLFVDCKKGVTIQEWDPARWHDFITQYEQQPLHVDVDIDTPPYSVQYPDLTHLLQSPNINFAWRNTAIRCGQFFGGDTVDERFAGNVVGGVSVDQWLEGGARIPSNAVIPAHDSCMPIPIGKMGLLTHMLGGSVPRAR